jgi:hypothetical protein
MLAVQGPSLELDMSDISSPATPTSPATIVPRDNGRFAKGGPGGPGRPRGSVNRDRDSILREEIRSEAARTRALILACLGPAGPGRSERRQTSLRRFSDGLRRLLSVRRLRKGPQSKDCGPNGFPTV